VREEATLLNTTRMGDGDDFRDRSRDDSPERSRDLHGHVTWSRDLHARLAAAITAQVSSLILFTEF